MRRPPDAVGRLTAATIHERMATTGGVDAGPVSLSEPSLVRPRGCNGFSSTLRQSGQWGVVCVSEHWNSGEPNTTDGRMRVCGCRHQVGRSLHVVSSRSSLPRLFYKVTLVNIFTLDGAGPIADLILSDGDRADSYRYREEYRDVQTGKVTKWVDQCYRTTPVGGRGRSGKLEAGRSLEPVFLRHRFV